MELDIDTERKVFTSHRPTVELAMLIATLDAAVGIAQENLYTLLATQLFPIRFLHTLLADVVASLVVVIVLNIGLRDLCHIAQDVGCIGILVLTDAALLHIETGEAEHLLPAGYV